MAVCGCRCCGAPGRPRICCVTRGPWSTVLSRAATAGKASSRFVAAPGRESSPELQCRYAAAVTASLGWAPEPGRFHLFRIDIDEVTFIRYDDATGDQYVRPCGRRLVSSSAGAPPRRVLATPSPAPKSLASDDRAPPNSGPFRSRRQVGFKWSSPRPRQRGGLYWRCRWQNRRVERKHSPPEAGVAGVVKWFDADEGWGVIVAPEVPGDCFAHFSSLHGPVTGSCTPVSGCASPTRSPASCRMAVASVPCPVWPQSRQPAPNAASECSPRTSTCRPFGEFGGSSQSRV